MKVRVSCKYNVGNKMMLRNRGKMGKKIGVGEIGKG